MTYKILVVEDDGTRITTFIEYLGQHELKIVDSIEDAKIELYNNKYDYLFLASKVGEDGKPCTEIIEFILEDLMYHPFVIIHTLDMLAMESMRRLLPEANWRPFGSEDFYFLVS